VINEWLRFHGAVFASGVAATSHENYHRPELSQLPQDIFTEAMRIV